LAVIPIITIRGVHLQKTMAGLIMETTALLVGEVQQKEAGPVTFI
jgi:hypothetical protein